MNQGLDMIWKGQIIASRVRDMKCGDILNFELYMRKQKDSISFRIHDYI